MYLLKHKWFSNVMLVVFRCFLKCNSKATTWEPNKKSHGFPPQKPHGCRSRKGPKPRGFHETPRFRFRCGVIRPLWRAAWKPSCEDEPSWKPIFGPQDDDGLLDSFLSGCCCQRLAMTQHVPKDGVFFQWCLFFVFFKADIVEKHIILFGRCDFWSDFDLSHRTAIDGIIPELYPVVVAFYCIYYSMYSFVTYRGFIMVPMPGNSTVCSFPSLM